MELSGLYDFFVGEAASSLSQEMSNVSSKTSSICKDGGTTAYTERGGGTGTDEHTESDRKRDRDRGRKKKRYRDRRFLNRTWGKKIKGRSGERK